MRSRISIGDFGEDIALVPAPRSPTIAISSCHPVRETEEGSGRRAQLMDETASKKDTPGAAAKKLSITNLVSPFKTAEGRNHTPYRERMLKDSWLWEILGAFLSITCMAAVIMLGLYLDGSSLSEWRFAIAPSTMISTLVTVSKTSILLPVAESLSQLKWVHFSTKQRPLNELETFDDASRGPWGSLMLLWKMKFRSVPALCGAFLTVATLAMAPFAQQIVSTQFRSIPRASSNASILVTNTYESGSSTEIQDGIIQSKAADVKMQGAVFSAIFNLGSNPFDFVCPSASCTWPDFASLAVCSTCANVTGSTKVRNEENRTVLVTPGGESIDFNLTTSASSGKWYNETVYAKVRDSEAAETIVLYAAAQLKTPRTVTAEEAQWDVTECQFEWCVKLYKDIKVVEGSMQPMDIHDIPLRTKANQNDPSRNAEDIDSSDFWKMVPIPTQDWQDGKKPLPPFENSTFLVSRLDYSTLKEFLGNVVKYGNPAIMIGNALEYPANMASLVHNTTDSMTNAVRTGRNAIAAQGVIWDPDTYIVIQWPWLSLPISLVLLSTVFLFATVVFTSRHSAPLWKSGLLPFIFHGIEPEDLREDELRELRGGQLDRVHEMEQRAREIQARLWKSMEGGTRLVRD